MFINRVGYTRSAIKAKMMAQAERVPTMVALRAQESTRESGTGTRQAAATQSNGGDIAAAGVTTMAAVGAGQQQQGLARDSTATPECHLAN